MRRITLLLALLPLACFAEIPIADLVAVAPLQRADGHVFSSRVVARVDGDRVAVLDQADNTFAVGGQTITLFARQPGGAWQQTALVEAGNATLGAAQDLDLQGDVLVVARRPTNSPFDGTNNRVVVFERIGNLWQETTSLPVVANGSVKTRDGWIAVSRTQGIQMFRRTAPGTWQPDALLPQDGISSLGDNVRGPSFGFDGTRVVIGTNVSPNAVSLEVAGRTYQLQGGAWVRGMDLPTRGAFFEAFSIAPRAASVAGGDASVAGVIYRDNGYGYWETTTDTTSITESLRPDSVVELTRGGYGWVTSRAGRDLYVRGADGYWRPRVRLADNAPTILATGEEFAVGARITINADPRLPGTSQLSIILLSLTAESATALARFSNVSINGLALSPLSTVTLTAFVDTQTSGNSVLRSAEYRVGNGPWQPMQARDGAFDSKFEWLVANIDFPDEFSGSVPVCLRVTDTANRRTALLDRGADPCPVVLGRPQPPFFEHYGDLSAPRVSEVMLANTQVQPGQDNVVYAFADDSGEMCQGQDGCRPTTVLGLQFQIDDGVWRMMQPFGGTQASDFGFGDSEFEAAQGVLPPARGLGHHQVCVRAVDSRGNVSLPQCVAYEVAQ